MWNVFGCVCLFEQSQDTTATGVGTAAVGTLQALVLDRLNSLEDVQSLDIPNNGNHFTLLPFMFSF